MPTVAAGTTVAAEEPLHTEPPGGKIPHAGELGCVSDARRVETVATGVAMMSQGRNGRRLRRKDSITPLRKGISRRRHAPLLLKRQHRSAPDREITTASLHSIHLAYTNDYCNILRTTTFTMSNPLQFLDTALFPHGENRSEMRSAGCCTSASGNHSPSDTRSLPSRALTDLTNDIGSSRSRPGTGGSAKPRPASTGTTTPARSPTPVPTPTPTPPHVYVDLRALGGSVSRGRALALKHHPAGIVVLLPRVQQRHRVPPWLAARMPGPLLENPEGAVGGWRFARGDAAGQCRQLLCEHCYGQHWVAETAMERHLLLAHGVRGDRETPLPGPLAYRATRRPLGGSIKGTDGPRVQRTEVLCPVCRAWVALGPRPRGSYTGGGVQDRQITGFYENYFRHVLSHGGPVHFPAHAS